MPDSTYDHPPPGLSRGYDDTPYADWLIPIFDEWFDAGDVTFQIRLFQNIIALIFGCATSTENIGGRENDVLVIETDGGIEPVDVLKACGEDFTKLGMNVRLNELDDVYGSLLVRTYQVGAAALCHACRDCAIRDVCGGGHLPHRYSSRTGFANPSVYCRDLAKLITHVQARVLQTLPDRMIERHSLAPVNHRDVWHAAAGHWRDAFPPDPGPLPGADGAAAIATGP